MYSNGWRLQCQYLLLQIARVHKEKRCLRGLISHEMLSLLVSLCAQMRGLTALKHQELKLMAQCIVGPTRCVYLTSALICLTFLNI